MPSALQQTVVGLEYALVLAGLVLLAWLSFSAAGRTIRSRPAALDAWNITLVEFLFLAWLVLVLGLLGQVLVRITLGPWLHRQTEGETLELIVYGSMFHVGAIMAWLSTRLIGRWHRAPRVSVEPARVSPSALRHLGGGSLTFLAVMPIVTGASLGWEYLLKLAGLPTERQELVDFFTQTQSPALLIVMVLLALVVAPISEELVFRAGLFRFLRTRGPRWVAYVVSAGLFAMLHANWASFLPLLILGLIFAAAYERTGRVAVPMIAHALFNLNTLLLVLSGVGQ